MAKLRGMTAADVAKKLINNVGAAGNNYIAGVMGVTEAPGLAAMDQSLAYLQGVQDNVDKWRRNVGNVTLQDWQAACKNKGAGRLAAGIQAAQKKIQAFWQNWMPILQNAQATVRAMPKATFQDRMARMTAMATLLHQAKGQAK